jgi:hypothetical protein
MGHMRAYADDYDCVCRDGWTGQLCENRDPCFTVDCGAHGSCSRGICACESGYSGDSCQTQPAHFVVVQGPCTVSEGGRCVGRPHGYQSNEACEIVVAGQSGTIGSCPNQNLAMSYGDWITTPDGVDHGRSCPQGTTLPEGSRLQWRSDSVGVCEGGCRWQYCFAV